MSRRRPLRRAALHLPVVAAVALAACQDSSQTPPPTVTVTETESASPEALDKPEQRQLTTKEAKAALPTLDDLPEGYHVDDSELVDRERSTEPDRCVDLYLGGATADTFREDHEKAEAQARFGLYRGGHGKDIVGVYVTSHDEAVPLTIFEEAGDAVAECSSFTETLAGRSVRYETQAIAVRPLGERSFGVRLSQSRRAVDRLSVRSGRNLVTVVALNPHKQFDEELLGDLAEGVLEKLAADTG